MKTRPDASSTPPSSHELPPLAAFVDRGDENPDEYAHIENWLYTHSNTIQAAVQDGIHSTTLEHKQHDIEQIRKLAALKVGFNDSRGARDQLALAHDILHNGIEGAVQKISIQHIPLEPSDQCPECDTDGQPTVTQPETIDDVVGRIDSNDIIQAISAIIVRENYLRQLYNEPEAHGLNPELFADFTDYYTDQIRYALYLAGRISERESTTPHVA